MSTETTATHYDSPVEIAKDARKAIRAAFPGLKFSLTNSTGTGYGWLHLSWTDGPTDEAMKAVTNQFDARLGGYTHINASRHYSPEAEAWAETQVAATWLSNYDHDGSTYYTRRRILAGHTF